MLVFVGRLHVRYKLEVSMMKQEKQNVKGLPRRNQHPSHDASVHTQNNQSQPHTLADAIMTSRFHAVLGPSFNACAFSDQSLPQQRTMHDKNANRTPRQDVFVRPRRLQQAAVHSNTTTYSF